MIWKAHTPGIPDDLFLREEKIPITKEEVRVIQISKARLCQSDIVYDLGCGSGSITVEAARQIKSSGKVFAVDIDPNAVSLTKKNIEKFQIENVEVISRNAIEKISSLPEANAIFIGGTGGDTLQILEQCEKKLKIGGRIVLGIILIETLFLVLNKIRSLRFDSIDITQIAVSKSRKTSTGTMMLSRNPVTIISASRI